MKKMLLFSFTFCAATSTLNAYAYSTPTHAAMTAYAVVQSKLANDPDPSPIIKKLGLTEFVTVNSEAPFRANGIDRYIAISSSLSWLHADAEFEKGIMFRLRRDATGLSIPTDYTLAGWMMRGAIREDDNDVENPGSDEPGGVFARVFGHFYDPHFGRGLTVYGLNIGAGASDWAFTEGATVQQSASNPISRKSIYNLPAAREAMWRALTGKTKDGQDPKPDGTDSATTDTAVRKAYWASTFRILGDLVHLLKTWPSRSTRAMTSTPDLAAFGA